MVRKYLSLAIMSLCLLWTLNAGAVDVRVALVEGQNTLALQAEHEFKILDLYTGSETIMPKGKYFANVADGNIRLEEQGFSQAIELQSLAGKNLPVINGRRYDGVLQIKTEGKSLLATNVLDVEQLLYRVLPQKTMPVWPDDAIKAQAVAARTYAHYRLKQNRSRAYDLSALDKELPYYGIGQRVEKPAITKLIKATEGQLVADAWGEPILAISTSSSGGKTESGLGALGKDYAYLQSVEDFDNDSPEYTWEFRISPEYVQNLLEQNGYVLGKLMNIRLSTMEDYASDRTATGRVKYIIFGGTIGTAKLTGERLAELLNLNSNCFDVETGTPAPESLKISIENYYGEEVARKEIPIKVKMDNKQVWSNFLRSHHVISGAKDEKIIFKGKGKGHGAGLSAWGAKGMASGEEPKSYQEILTYYYPGTYVVKD